MNRGIRLTVLALVLASATTAFAQWSSDTNVNLSIGDGNGDQVQPKIVPTADGGCYISWFDNGATTTYKYDTWTWSGSSWTYVATQLPSARARHALAYDSARNRTVLFGGVGGAGVNGDTWEWNNTAWSQINVTGPSARESFGMVFDAARGVVVLFGGLDGASSLQGDTWTYDGTAWTHLSPATSPSARKGHAMAYDPARQVVVLFGGEDAGGKQADTWEWNGTTWTQVATANAPSARTYHGMEYDLLYGQTLLFGGSDSGDALQNDTWHYDGTNWTLQATATIPNARSGLAMSTNFHTGSTNFSSIATISPTVAVAGQNVTVSYNAAGRSLATATQVYMHYGYNNWTTVVGTDIAMTFNAGLSRWQTTIALPAHLGQLDVNFNDGLGTIDDNDPLNNNADWHYDVSDFRPVMYGGFNGSFNQGMQEWNGFNWISKSGISTTRNHTALAFDSTLKKVVLFGGFETAGYDVKLQRLNAKGQEVWPHNGILVSDRMVSSTVDYGIACDASDNVVVALNDDRFLVSKITVQKISPAGALLWNGELGVQVGDGSTAGSPPKIAALSDGGYVVVWNSTTSPTQTKIQKIDANGNLAWPTISQGDPIPPTPRPFQASDVKEADLGGFIVLFVRCGGSNCVTSAKNLYAQKYDSTGAPVWGGGQPIAIYTASGLSTGYFPTFLSDGAGGAVFGFYEGGLDRNAFVQHVLSDGTLKFASPVSCTAATASRIINGAGVAYNRDTSDYYLAVFETDSTTQSQDAVLVQKFDTTGTRQWGDFGLTLLPAGTGHQPGFVQCQVMGDGVTAYWQQLTSAVTRIVAAAHVDNDQSIVWNVQPASNGGEDKSRLTSTVSTCGYHILAFGNGSSGNTNIRAQNVRLDGTFGPPAVLLGDMNCDGVVNTGDISLFIDAVMDSGAWTLAHPCCEVSHADMNADSSIDGLDLQGFTNALVGP